MKASTALETILYNGLDNSTVQINTLWGDHARMMNKNNVEFAEDYFGEGTVVLEVYRYTPVDQVLFVWRNMWGDETDFRSIEQPILVVKDACGSVVEIYELV